MTRILYAWELGWQLSHLGNIGMLARGMRAEGHEIGVAARELHGAERFLAGLEVQYYQSPFDQAPTPELSAYQSYAHLLYASGFADARDVAVRISAWLGILDSFGPDLIVCDHSPTLLLASRALGLPRILVGSGFLVPPPTGGGLLGVFPDVPEPEARHDALERDESEVLRVVNGAAAAFGRPALERLGDLYDEVDDRVLLTLPELDPFERAPDTVYQGVFGIGPEARPSWSGGGDDARVFAYLSPFPGCEALLHALEERGAEALVFAPALPAAARAGMCSDRVRFLDDIVDLRALAGACDLFVSNSAHTSVATTLLAGIPQLLVPIYREQALTADRVESLGAGRIEAVTTTDWGPALSALLDGEGPRSAAAGCARRHADFDPQEAARAAQAQILRWAPS